MKTVVVLTCRLLLTTSISYPIITSSFHYIIMSCLIVRGHAYNNRVLSTHGRKWRAVTHM